jgi:hypothetical protein
MKLKNLDGSSFSLDIVGYQFPDHQDDYWDANWLMMQIQIQLSEHFWSVKDPCLTTFEVQKLIEWFHQLSIHATDNTSLGFTEHYIQFELIIDHNENQSLRLNYIRPPKEGIIYSEKDTISIDFPSSQIPFAEIIEDLQNQLAKFPQRVFRIGTKKYPKKEKP